MADKVDESFFNDFSGYYSVMLNGVEFARFAPSPLWTDFWNNNSQQGWTFAWIPASV